MEKRITKTLSAVSFIVCALLLAGCTFRANTAVQKPPEDNVFEHGNISLI